MVYSHKVFEDKEADPQIKNQWNFEHNEKIQKIYRSHCDGNVIDGRFIEHVLKESAGIRG